jgi:hypothetical protein
MIPAYQPETAYDILHRVMSRKDVATGTIDVTDNYTTNGTLESTTTLKPEPSPSPTCYLWSLPSTCAENQIEAIKDETATIEDYTIISPGPLPGTCPILPDEGSEGLGVWGMTGSYLGEDMQHEL